MTRPTRARPSPRWVRGRTRYSPGCRPLLADGDVALVSHGHLLRVLTARWLRLEPAGGRLFRLDTGTLCTLGTEHGEPVIARWNLPAGDR